MSLETSTWLNNMALIGFTERRGKAWHYRAVDQGTEPNHYTGAIPVEAVRRRLFNFEFAEGSVTSEYFGGNGFTTIHDKTRKTIIRPAGAFGVEDQGEILGIFKSGYQIHQYDEWLIKNVQTILDDGLQIGSAGLLKNGAIAWVQVELPDTIETPQGVAFRPFLSAATSVDGHLSSTYLTGNQLIVCDNTMFGALNAAKKAGTQVKVRHSKNSIGKVQDVRDAIGIMHSSADDFQAEIAAMCEVTVSDKDWTRFLAAHVEIKDGALPRVKTVAEEKRAKLNGLWEHDNRVEPWKNTAFGVVQAVNTYAHHLQGVQKGISRTERNSLRTVTGEWQNLQAETQETLRRVLASA